MTTQELINYYANLLILQYIGQPNAYATIQALVTMSVMNQLPLAVQNAFNLTGTTAVGVQLDIIGKYVGVTRNGVGLQGQVISLDDADFLTFIQLAIATNSFGSDFGTIDAFMNTNFPGEILPFDHKDMRMSYLISSSLGNQNLIELFITEGKLPVPMAVALSVIEASNLKFFGMVDSEDVYAYAQQNSVSISTAANAIATGNNISPLNDSTSPITGQWLDSSQGIPI